MRVLAGPAALALFFSACTAAGGDSRADGGLTPAGERPAESPPVTPPTEAGVESVFTSEDDVLTVAVAGPATLDPMRIRDPSSVLIARQLYEGLTRWDPVEERVVPGAARSWRVADGGRKFVFKLHPGMTFHDGSPVTSTDFRFAFDRIAQKKNASDLAFTLEPVRGFVEVNQLGRADHLAGVRTPDPLTLVIELTRPFRDFPVVLTHPGLVPLPARAVSRYQRFLRSPVGNGPFQMGQEWTGGPVLLKAFLGFVDTPEIDGIRFVPFADAASSWVPFLQGDVDVSEVPAGQFALAEEEFGDDGFKPFLASYFYGLNVKSKQLRDRRLRKAISLGIDRSEIRERIFKGTLGRPRGIVPEGMPGFFENACVNLCRHRQNSARRLVAELPRKARDVTLEFTGGAPHGRVARLIKADLKDVGLNVRVESFAFSRYVKRLRRGEQAAYRVGWIAEYPSPDAFLWSLFHSSSPDNHSGLKSNKVDRLLQRARSDPSPAKRLQFYRDAEKAILSRLPVVPVGSFVSHWAARERVAGIEFDLTGGFDAVAVSLTETPDQ